VASNRRLLEQAMRAGSSAAWEGEWDRAVQAYQKALRVAPRSIGALANLGLAYANAGNPQAALQAYLKAVELSPATPGLLERLAQVHEQLGQGEFAAEAYLRAAEHYARHHDTKPLVARRLHDAVLAWPDCIRAHETLVDYYQHHGDIDNLLNECAFLAMAYARAGRPDDAAQVCERGLNVSPTSAVLRATRARIAVGDIELSEAPVDSERARDSTASRTSPVSPTSTRHVGIGISGGAPTGGGNPIDVTREKALAELANRLFEDTLPESEGQAQSVPSRPGENALLSQAIDFQAKGQITEAIEAYEQTVHSDGASSPAVCFNLGLLHLSENEVDRATERFEQSVRDSAYELGSHLALGQCHASRGTYDAALEHLSEALRIVDLATTLPDQADDLTAAYALFGRGEATDSDPAIAQRLTVSFERFLSANDWEMKVSAARTVLDTLSPDGPAVSLAEMLEVSSWDLVLPFLSKAQQFAKQGLQGAALDQCYSALAQAPSFLPIHHQLAQLLLKSGKTEAAAQKCVTMAEVYRTRGLYRQAIALLDRALRLSPLDTDVRSDLIELLVAQGEVDRALDHYTTLADGFYQLARTDKALETYREALLLAPRSESGRAWSIRLLRGTADLEAQQLDWHRAVDIYEQTLELDPDDERSLSSLVDLYYRVDRPSDAVRALRHLIEVCRARSKEHQILTALEAAVRDNPEDITLLALAAQSCLDLGDADLALKYLDQLGDLQLTAGLYEELKPTLRAILALNPPNPQSYRNLLTDINARTASAVASGLESDT
jgi:tetratricopeptide (TPR) repeat protein